MIDLAIITGCGSGLGKSLALYLASKNIDVWCISKAGNVYDTRKEIEDLGYKASSLCIDIGNNLEGTEKTVDWKLCGSNYKNIAVILNAAVVGDSQKSITDVNLEDWNNTYRINLLGNLAVLKGVLPTMLKNNFGRIVFLAGGGAASPNTTFSGYACSKVAIVREVEQLHEELKDKGDFSIVALAPGAMETNMLKKVREAGAYVKTTTDISEPVNFIDKFINSEQCGFSGRFVHVRDNWEEYYFGDIKSDKWLLRRIE
jgi:3-oxoacyl-[acyl-carrier protein] reductase